MVELENLIEVSDSTFEEKVLNAEQPVLVDFGAKWCGPCVLMAPAFAEIAADYSGEVQFATYDTEHSEGTKFVDKYSTELGVMGIPLLILFREGEAVGYFNGFGTKAALEQDIKELLKN